MAPPPRRPSPPDLVLPVDIDALAVAKAVRAKLDLPEGDEPPDPLERRKLGGRVDGASTSFV